MYCKDCKNRDKFGWCTSEKLQEKGDHDKEANDQLIYFYNESGCFIAQDYFGCVHFEEKGK